MTTVLITGANRGIGLEFTRRYAAEGARVLACCRAPENADDLKTINGDVTLYAVDVLDDATMTRLAETLAGESIDILINNAGIYGPRNAVLGELDYDAWAEVFRVNTMGPARMSELFLEQVARSEQKIIANVTSKMGSMGDNSSGGSYIYRSSKAALNAVTKSMAMDLKSRDIKVAVLHPGWVQTDMGGPNGLIDTQTSVSGMKNILDNLDMAQTGSYFDYNGSIIPW